MSDHMCTSYSYVLKATMFHYYTLLRVDNHVSHPTRMSYLYIVPCWVLYLYSCECALKTLVPGLGLAYSPPLLIVGTVALADCSNPAHMDCSDFCAFSGLNFELNYDLSSVVSSIVGIL